MSERSAFIKLTWKDPDGADCDLWVDAFSIAWVKDVSTSTTYGIGGRNYGSVIGLPSTELWVTESPEQVFQAMSVIDMRDL